MFAQSFPGQGGDTVMCEFRCGRMKLDGTRMSADPRKGKIQVTQCEDGMTHFRWVNRDNDVTEDDIIVFPDETVFEKLPQANARVMLLKFKEEPNRNMFFWMQEPKKDEDMQVVAEINEALGNTGTTSPLAELSARAAAPIAPTPAPLPTSYSAATPAPNPSDTDMTPSGAAPASEETPAPPPAPSKAPESVGTPSATPSTAQGAPATTPQPAAATPTQGPVQLSDLQSILGSLNVPQSASPGAQPSNLFAPGPMPSGNLFAPGPMGAQPAATGSPSPGGGLDAASLAAALGAAASGSRPGSAGPSLLQQMAAMQQRQVAPGPSLSDVLKPDVVMPLLSGSEVQQRLQQYLPEEHRSAEHMMSLVSSPQFAQQLETFSRALQTGQVDLATFGLNAAGFSVEDFLKAIEAHVEEQSSAPKQMEE